MSEKDDPRLRDILRAAFLEDMGLTPTEDDSLVVVGPYRVIEPLGEGATGRVFHAIQNDLLKHVALKVLDSGPGTTRSRLERFRREATTAARLRHPNIVGVHDIGQDGRYHYIAMDLIEGGTLLDWLEREKPLLEEKLRVFEIVARAVAHAHGTGVLHRDLKPQNILMRGDGQPVVVDFGLARRKDDESLTQDGAVMGTPSYMAPEQIRGAIRELDARTDVYALGVILYQVITGTVPYSGASTGTIYDEVQHRRARPPSMLRSDVPRAIDILTSRCLDPDPELRYGTALELADDVARLRKGEPLVATPISRLTLAGRSLLSRKRGLVAVVLAVGILLLTLWLTRDQREELDRISYAHRLQSAYGDLVLRLDPVLSRAEEQRYSRAEAEQRQAILDDLDRRLAEAGDETGVGAAYRAWVMFLLQHPDAEEELREARRRYPENPFVPLTAARAHLLHYAEHVTWPSAQGVSLYATAEPFQSPRPIETEEMSELLADARRDVLEAIHSDVWQELPSLRWILDLCDGVERFAAGDLTGAIEHLPDLGDRPDLELDASLLLALAYCRLGDTDSAFEVAHTLYRARPRLRPAVHILSECYSHRGYRKVANRQDPLEDFREARRLLAEWPDRSHFELQIANIDQSIASARISRGEDPRAEYLRALEVYDRHLAGQPDDFRTLTNRAMTLAHLGRARPGEPLLMDRAIEDIEKAWDLSSGNALVGSSLLQIHLSRLVVLRQQGTLEDDAFTPARDAFDRVEQRIPETAATVFSRASLHLVHAHNLREKGQAAADEFQLAAQVAARAAEISPRFLEARQLACTATLLLALERRQPTEQVLAIVQEAAGYRRLGIPTSLSPSVIATWLEQLASGMNQADAPSLIAAAADAWEQQVAEHPEDITARGRLALEHALLARLGGLPERSPHDCEALARLLADEAIELGPDHAAGYAVRGLIRLQQEDHESALEDIEKAVNLQGGEAFVGRIARAGNDLAWRIVREPAKDPTEYRRALRLIELATYATPTDGHLLNTLGVAHYRVGEFARAREVLLESDALNRQQYAGGHPADVVFLALACFHLGQVPQAEAEAKRARGLMEFEPFRDDPECRFLIDEMESAMNRKNH